MIKHGIPIINKMEAHWLKYINAIGGSLIPKSSSSEVKNVFVSKPSLELKWEGVSSFEKDNSIPSSQFK